MPSAAARPGRVPRASATETTKSTAGPGGEHSTASGAQKAGQGASDMGPLPGHGASRCRPRRVYQGGADASAASAAGRGHVLLVPAHVPVLPELEANLAERPDRLEAAALAARSSR